MNDTYVSVSASAVSENMQTIDFVHITREENREETGNCMVYRVHYVVDGVGTVWCDGVATDVKQGDIFFLVPAVSYSIAGNDDFEYMYISYAGPRADAEMKKRNIHGQNFVFRDFQEIYPLWMQGMGYHLDGIELISESLVLYTLARITERIEGKGKKRILPDSADSARLIKKYVDKNFTDPQLSMDKISSCFSYNKKYISTLFKKHYKIGVTDYMNMLRVNYACVLIAQGSKNITQIAFRCGFNDSSYFSRVFKKKMGISPSQYISKGGSEPI